MPKREELQWELDFSAPAEPSLGKNEEKTGAGSPGSEPRAAAKLEDFGEDLGNTRRGRTAARAAWQSLEGDELFERIAREPLERIWPAGSIQKLAQKNRRGAAFLWCVRRNLGPRRPVKPRELKRYAGRARDAILLQRRLEKGESPGFTPTEAGLDGFFEANRAYERLALIDPECWPFLHPFHITNGRTFCETNRCTPEAEARVPEEAAIVGVVDQGGTGGFRVTDGRGHTIDSWRFFAGETLEAAGEAASVYLKEVLADRIRSRAKAGRTAVTEPAHPNEAPVRILGIGESPRHCGIYGEQGSVRILLEEKSFRSAEEFFAYRTEHFEALKAKFLELRIEYGKPLAAWKSEPIRERIGPDWRGGRDVTPEMFTEDFGFRGVEFGNWVRQGKESRERQWMLTNAFDALHDLAEALGIPPKAVSLNGELGLCFGSRGSGSAAAHYDAAGRVINLTKTRGYSSLAHEWFHALDHYMARTTTALRAGFESDIAFVQPERVRLSDSGRAKVLESLGNSGSKAVEAIEQKLTDRFAVNGARSLGKGAPERFPDEGVEVSAVRLKPEDVVLERKLQDQAIRPELDRAWRDVVSRILESRMAERMKAKSGYWKSRVEMAARSFEGFVEARLESMGQRNDFLTVDSFSRAEAKRPGFYPYLDGGDVERVGEAFGKLFGVMRAKETDKGTMLFSKRAFAGETPETPETIRRALVRALGEDTIRGLEDSGLLRIVRSLDAVEGLQSPEGFRFSPRGAVQGVYGSGSHRAYLIAEGLTAHSARAVLFHEVGVHAAYDSVLRRQMLPLIDAAPAILERAAMAGDPAAVVAGMRLAASGISPGHPDWREEACAYLVEACARRMPEDPGRRCWFESVKSAMKLWLVRHGFARAEMLEPEDLVAAARANVHTLSRMRERDSGRHEPDPAKRASRRRQAGPER